MVQININGISIPLVGAHSPINFSFHLTSHRIKKYEGELNLNRIRYVGEDIKEIKDISISNGLNSFSLNSFINQNINQCDGEITLNLKFEDIFSIYDSVLKILSSSYVHNESTYDCYSTSMKCNLSCNYCMLGCDYHHKSFPNSNFILGEHFIKKIKDITLSNVNSKKRAIRLMGGETLIDIKNLIDTFKFALKMNNQEKLDDVWIYTNYTINVDKFLDEVIGYISENSKHITIVATTDSFHFEKSVRTPSEKMCKLLYNNIKKTCDKYRDNNKISVVSNVMYIDKETTKKTTEELYKLGVSYVQIAYDEFLKAGDITSTILPKIREIYSEIETIGIKRLKPNLGKTMWVHFSVSDDDHEIYRSKYSFKSKEDVLSFLNDY